MMTSLFYFSILFLTFLRQAASTEIYVDSKSSRSNTSNQPNGTITSPYHTLADAWNNLSLNSQLNVTIYLANGVYQLPTMGTNGSMIINIQPKDASNPSVFISTIDTQEGLQETAFTPNLMVQAQSTFQFKSIHFTSTLQSPPLTAFFVDGNSTLSIFDCILENGPNSATSAFQFSASGNSSMIIQSLTANSVFLEMSASDSGDLSIDSSYFNEAKGSVRGLVVALDNATATVNSSNFVKITGNIIGLQQLSNLVWESSDISEVVCDQNQFGIAMIQHDSQLFIRNSVLANVSATQGITCSGGLMGIYNQGQITIENSKLQKMVGRLVYAEGNSTLTISSNSLLESLFEPDQVGQGGAQYLGSIRGNAQVQLMDSILNTLTGSWIILENGYLAIQRVSVIDNFCPSSKSYWVSLAGTAMLAMNGVQFHSSFGVDQHMLSQLKACTIVTASEQALVSISESWISQYKCRSACLISRGQSLVTLDQSKFSQLYSSDSRMSLISLTDQAQHSISRLNCSENTGNSPSVIGILGLDIDPFIIQITNSIFSNNQIPSLAIGQGASILISHSNFTNNLVPLGGGSPVINQGSLTISTCTFTDNAGAKLGGAIYHSGTTLAINESSFFRNRACLDGGGLYLSAPANLTSIVFLNNIARRGGGWFSLDSATGLHNVSDISYGNNQPNNFAGTFHSLELGGNGYIAPTSTNRLLARPGSTLNTTIEVRALDAYGQLYQYGGLDSVILIKAYIESSTDKSEGNNLKLIGETTQALVRGVVLFRGIQVYGPEPPQSVNNTLLYRLKVSRQLPNGELDSETSVSVPLTLQGCRSDSMLEPSSAWGPEYLSCTLLGCPQGCSNGQCVSAGNCVCLPGWEGLACDQKSEDVDSIVWQFYASAFPYASVGVRNALGSQIQALAENLNHMNKTETKSEYTAQLREFRKVPEDQSIIVRFIVINTILNEIVQENQLAEINSELLRSALQPNTPIIRSRTPVFGYTWPPTMGLSNSLVSTSIKKVKKVSISVRDPIGASLIMVHLLGLAGALALWIFLVVLPSHNSAIVRSSTQLWLTWYTLGTIILHLWMIAGAMPPTDYVCRLQFCLSTIAVATMMGANLFKAYHLYLTYENPVLTKLSDDYAVIYSNATSNNESTKKSYMGLGWSASGLVLPTVIFIGLETIVLLGWLIPSSSLISAKVTWSANAGSYWHCTLTPQLLVPGAFVFYVVNIFISAVTLYMLRRVKHAVSLSQEPKICLFVTLNVIGSLSIIASIQSTPGSFGVVVQYMIMSFALGMCLYVSSMGNLGYKVWLIMKAKNNSKHNSPLKKRDAKPHGTNKAPQMDEIDESLCQLQQSNVLASALVPVRILGKRTTGLWTWPTPWDIAFLEIAKEYRYLTVLLDDKPARFFGLPCFVQVDRPSMVIRLKFKSGTLLEVQTRSLLNLDEWESVFQHVNTPIKQVDL